MLCAVPGELERWHVLELLNSDYLVEEWDDFGHFLGGSGTPGYYYYAFDNDELKKIAADCKKLERGECLYILVNQYMQKNIRHRHGEKWEYFLMKFGLKYVADRLLFSKKLNYHSKVK